MGTWSDDTSLALCTVEGLMGGFDLDRIAHLFVRWFYEGLHTPWGKVFDYGGITARAIIRLKAGVPPDKAGQSSEWENGNGSLMRILPTALYFFDADDAALTAKAHLLSGLTHRHPRSLMACGIYCLMAAAIIRGASPGVAYTECINRAKALYDGTPFSRELPHFRRILEGRIPGLSEGEIGSQTYVVDTLEASIWCLLTTDTFPDAVLKAVNLGDDTDTTGAVTGGLAGLSYGLSSIPGAWISVLARKEEMEALFLSFTDDVERRGAET